MNVGIIGLGNIGFNCDKNNNNKTLSLTKAFSREKFFNLIIGVEKKKKVRNIFKRKNPSTEVSNKISIFKGKKIHLIAISTPTKMHKTSIYQTLNYIKKPKLLIEKPISYRKEEFQEILKIINSKKIVAFINYQRQSNPLFINLREKLKRSKKTEIVVKYSKGIYNNASHFLTFLISVYGRSLKILKTQNLKKYKNDYLINFDIKYKKCLIKFRYTQSTNQMTCIDNKIFFVSNKDKIIFRYNKKNVYNKKEISEIIRHNQLYVIKNLEKFFKKKKSNLCRLNKSYVTELIINNIINFKNV